MLVKKVAIAFSGEGSNLEVLIQSLHKKEFRDFRIEVVAAITNKPQAKGIQRAKRHGVDVVIVDHTEFADREAFDTKLVSKIDALNVDLVVLAGFMRILTPIFTQNIRAVNIHPSLLPLYKGANALERSFEGEEKMAGVSVHFVIDEVDGGEIIKQKQFDKEGMDFQSFKERIHTCEHEVFPQAVIEVLSKEV